MNSLNAGAQTMTMLNVFNFSLISIVLISLAVA